MDYFVDITGIESSYAGDPTKNYKIGALSGSMEQDTAGSEGGGKAKDFFTPENVGAGLQVIGAILPGMQKSDQERLIKRACGRRPLIGKGRKATYEECVSKLFASMNNQGDGGKGSRTVEENRNTMLLVGAVALGLILIILLIVFLLRKNKTK